MPRTRECDYCGADIEPGTGTMFVRNNGTTVHFCSSKCENNADLGREARNLEWTASGRGAAGETVEDAETVEEADESEASPAPDLEAAEDVADEEAEAETEEDAEAEDEGESETDDEEAEEAEA